jgi:DNA-binding transcriptional LysR family regulator
MICGDMAELDDLRSFAVLAGELHFARAAERLSVNPSTLSRRIRAIEHELGVPLFTRTSRTVALTDAGRELAARLPRILRDLDAALAGARAAAEAPWEV